MSEDRSRYARSFGPVADAYDRARPSYPPDAVSWLTGRGRSFVLELGAGTGKLTEVLHAQGHDVLATEPLPEMLRRLRTRAPVAHVASGAEHIPLRSRTVDVVVCGQSFHWFDHDLAIAEIARVLRPGGVLALVWNDYDESIPWVRRLQRLISPQRGAPDEAVMPLMESPYFGFVEKEQFRFWQPHTARSLDDLARSVSHVATMGEEERAEVLDKIAELYASYGRGHDGMQVPYITHCYRAVVRHQELPPEAPAPVRDEEAGPNLEGAPVDPLPAQRRPPEDPGTQLIDFR